MEIYRKKKKSIPGWHYWGDYGEIDIGLSSGFVSKGDKFAEDKLHYHRKGTVYLFTLKGRGLLEVEGKKIEMGKNSLIRIDPGEKYRHLDALEKPLYWITICTSKDPKDKVIVR